MPIDADWENANPVIIRLQAVIIFAIFFIPELIKDKR
jgi:hypothetical protein